MMITAPPANQSSTGGRSVAHEEAPALLAVDGLVDPQLADAIDLDGRQREMAALGGGARGAGTVASSAAMSPSASARPTAPRSSSAASRSPSAVRSARSASTGSDNS